MKNPLVSVVIPAYNASNTLGNAVNSIIGQTYKKFELIVVDDGSEDIRQVEAILARFDDKRIKLIRRKHEGVVATRMAGYKAARGTLLAVQDADDLSMPNRLERAVNRFHYEPEIDVYFHAAYVNMWDAALNAMHWEYRTGDEKKAKELLKWQIINGWPVFKKEVIRKRPLRMETQHIYDWAFLLDWYYSGFKFGFDDHATYVYIRRANSLSERNEREGKRHESLLALKEIMLSEYHVNFRPIDFKI